jgi:tripartite-type tricarboxylate transporter receptor subunit TctC
MRFLSGEGLLNFAADVVCSENLWPCVQFRLAFSPGLMTLHQTSGPEAAPHVARLGEAVATHTFAREARIFIQQLLAGIWSWFRRAAAVVVVACATAGGDAHAGSDYPHQPVRIIVPYGPGGAGDLTIRLLANKLSQNLKQPFVIENRPGAGGIAAMRTVLSAPGDGYTLGEMGNGQAISSSLFQNLPYDVLRDFAQISIAASFAMLLVVPPTSPHKSVRDVVEAARKAPGKLNLAAINPGSTQNLSAHLFQQVSGAQFTIVTYRTTPDLVTALLRGEVDLGFDYFAGLESTIAPDKLHVIATSGQARDPLLKDVPTAKESGLPDYVVTSWNGVGARAGVPAEVIAMLSAEIRRALAAPDIQERMLRLGLEARGSTPEDMRDQMAKDMARWRGVIETAGIPKH